MCRRRGQGAAAGRWGERAGWKALFGLCRTSSGGAGGGARHLCLRNHRTRISGYANVGRRTPSPTGQRHRLWTSDPWGMTLEGCAISLCLVPERHKACAAVVLLNIGPRMRAENRRPSARGRFLCRRSACSAACRRSGAQVGQEGLFRLCKAGRGGTREPSGTCVWGETVGSQLWL